MDLTSKLNLKAGHRMCVIDQPAGLQLEFEPGVNVVSEADTVDACLVFMLDAAALTARRARLLEDGAADRITWLAYPKAGKMGTDLNRDTIRDLSTGSGVRPVRQISIDDTWSALRFRPG